MGKRPLQKAAQMFNRNLKTYSSVRIEDDVDERQHQEKESASTSKRYEDKENHSQNVPNDDGSGDEDGNDDFNDDGITHGNPNRCSYFGIVMSVAAGFFMACTSLMVKLAQSLPFYEVLAIRGLGLFLCSLPIMIYFFQPIIPTTWKETGLVYGRAILASGAIYGLYFSFQYISLADATTILFINPVWTAILAYFLLREKWSKYDSLALALSLTGVVLVARPSFLFPTQQSITSTNVTFRNISYAITFIGSFGLALSFILVRKSCTATPPLTFVFHYGLTCIVFGLLGGTSLQGLKFPNCGTQDNWYALLAMAFSFAGQGCFIYALSIEQAAIVAMGRATDIVFVLILEVIFLNVPINGFTLAGSVIVLLCNFILVIKKVYATDI